MPASAAIYENEADLLAAFVHRYPAIETGGDLFGYWTHSGAPVISFVIGPGRRSQHHPASFYQDPAWLHDIGVEMYDRHGLQHIGEWHSHHRLGLDEPSAGDIATVRAGMRRKDWQRFVLMIATLAAPPGTPVVQNYFLFTEGGGRVRRTGLRVLPGRSPFRPDYQDWREQPAVDGQVRWEAAPVTRAPAPLAAERYPAAWFATAPGKDDLRTVVEGLRRANVPNRIQVDRAGDRLRWHVSGAEYLMCPSPTHAGHYLVGASDRNPAARTPGQIVSFFTSGYGDARDPHRPAHPAPGPGGPCDRTTHPGGGPTGCRS